MQRAQKQRAVALNSFGPGAQAAFHICLGLFALMCIVPFIFVIIISFTSEDSIRQIGYSFAPLSWSTQAYSYVFALGRQLWLSYFNSFLITIVGTALSVAICILSSEAQEIIRLCDRALVLYHGAVRGELSGEKLNEQNIMVLATGGELAEKAEQSTAEAADEGSAQQ